MSPKLPAATQPLHGITVLDFSHVIAGPFATYYLAMQGARVVKVENPHRGDSLRRNPHAFAAFNHGKQVEALDLTTEEGRARAWQLFGEADVLVDNMRPGVLARFGFGEAQVRGRKPALIHCTISGYGRDSAWASRPAYDHVIQAASGMSLMAGGEGDDPLKVGFPVVDSVTGILAALAILAAIRRRDLTGQGESIDVSMLGAALQLMYPKTVEVLASGQAPSRVGNVGFSGSPGADTFHCSDGLLALGANTPQQMLQLGEILGVREQVETLMGPQTQGFATTHRPAELREVLQNAIGPQSADDLERRLSAVGVPAARVRDLAQCVADAAAQGLMERWALPGAEAAQVPVQVPGLGFRTRTLFGGNAIPDTVQRID
jgi:crotonobetainyl-CoA:carnitine CoA-transferase CaiB-like acyl-CoA transferase